MADVNKTRCKGKSRGKMFPYPTSPCQYKAWKDGYCKIHNPEEKLRKHKERMNEKEKLYQAAHRNRTNN